MRNNLSLLVMWVTESCWLIKPQRRISSYSGEYASWKRNCLLPAFFSLVSLFLFVSYVFSLFLTFLSFFRSCYHFTLIFVSLPILSFFIYLHLVFPGFFVSLCLGFITTLFFLFLLVSFPSSLLSLRIYMKEFCNVLGTAWKRTLHV